MADWLRELRTAIARDDAFFTEMDRQLTPSFESAVGESLERFLLRPRLDSTSPRGYVGPPKRTFSVRREGDVEVLDGDLLNLDYESPVTIEWHGGGGELTFGWRLLDAEDIRSWLSMRRAIRVRTAVPLEVDIRDPVWPNLTVAVEFGTDVPADITELVDNAFASLDPRIGHVHNVGSVRPSGPRSVSMQIDFGTTGVEALNHLLDRLAETATVTKVILDSPASP